MIELLDRVLIEKCFSPATALYGLMGSPNMLPLDLLHEPSLWKFTGDILTTTFFLQEKLTKYWEWPFYEYFYLNHFSSHFLLVQRNQLLPMFWRFLFPLFCPQFPSSALIYLCGFLSFITFLFYLVQLYFTRRSTWGIWSKVIKKIYLYK